MEPGDPTGTPDVPATSPATRTTFKEVFAVGEFRALWIAQVLSVAGDQLARVALTLLVFDRTHSAALAAVTFAASVVPTFVGGLVLSGLADRFPRREVMIACDLSSAVLIVAMALPVTPLVARVGLLFAVTLIGAPFSSARASLYPDVLPGDRYVVGTAITITTIQFAQVAGFAVGGAAVGLFGVRASLIADAVTFVASALLTRLLVRARPAAQTRLATRSASRSGVRAAVRLVFATPALRTPMLFGWLAAFVDVYEGVSAPLAKVLGGGAIAAGLILASGALGVSVGVIAFSRFIPASQRARWMAPLAIASCGVLILFAVHLTLPLALLVLAASGLLGCYQLPANAAFVSAVPPERRSQAFGLAQGGMSLGQGAAIVLAGAAAQSYAPSTVIAASGGLGAIVAVVIAASRPRT
jgi:MFS family permease